MKKNYGIFLTLFGLLNIVLLVICINSNRKYVDSIDNNIISFEMIDNYYTNEKYKEDSKKFKLYNNDGISTIDIYVLEQPYSNNIYTKEEVSRSINYQILKELNNYKEDEFRINEDIIYSKYRQEDNVVEIMHRYYGQMILVIVYVSNEELYDDSVISNINSKIILK